MLILGHRGAPKEAPENSISSFRRAIALGADGVELDVQRCSDGTPLVIHDATLERTTSGSGRVDSLTHDDISRFNTHGEPIPTLADAVAWAGGAGAVLNVEIKAPAVERSVISALQHGGMLEEAIISSFDARIVREVGTLAPRADRYLLTERWNEDAMRGFAHSDANGVCLRVDGATPTILALLRDEDIPVIVWTVDDTRRMRELMKAGVRGIITNLPGVAVETARDLGLR